MALTQEPSGTPGPAAVLQGHPSLQKFPPPGQWHFLCVCVAQVEERLSPSPTPLGPPGVPRVSIVIHGWFTEGDTETLQVAKGWNSRARRDPRERACPQPAPLQDAGTSSLAPEAKASAGAGLGTTRDRMLASLQLAGTDQSCVL